MRHITAHELNALLDILGNEHGDDALLAASEAIQERWPAGHFFMLPKVNPTGGAMPEHPSPSFRPNWDKKVYAWVLVDRLTGTIDHVEINDTPPSFEHEDEDTLRLVFEGYVNGGDSVEIDQRRSRLPRHNESRAIRNVRTAIWNNEA